MALLVFVISFIIYHYQLQQQRKSYLFKIKIFEIEYTVCNRANFNKGNY